METVHFAAPDLTALRYRAERLSTLSPAYCKLLRSELSSQEPRLATLTNKDIAAIVTGFNKLVIAQILGRRGGIKLPQWLGDLLLGSCPPRKKKNIDYKSSVELGRLVQHTNLATDGQVGKLIYINSEQRSRLANKSLWGFSFTKLLKQQASQAFRTNYRYYLPIETLRKEALLTAQETRHRRNRYKLGKWLETYSELD